MIYGSTISLDDNPLIYPTRQDEIIELTLSRKSTVICTERYMVFSTRIITDDSRSSPVLEFITCYFFQLLFI